MNNYIIYLMPRLYFDNLGDFIAIDTEIATIGHFFLL